MKTVLSRGVQDFIQPAGKFLRLVDKAGVVAGKFDQRFSNQSRYPGGAKVREIFPPGTSALKDEGNRGFQPFPGRSRHFQSGSVFRAW